MSWHGKSSVNHRNVVPTTFFNVAKIAYVERPAWQDVASCISPIRTVRSYVRPVFWPFSHGHDEIRGANRLISFSRFDALAILRSDLLRDAVPLGSSQLAPCLSGRLARKLVNLSLGDHLRSPIGIAANEKNPDDARDLVCECDGDNLKRAA